DGEGFGDRPDLQLGVSARRLIRVDFDAIEDDRAEPRQFRLDAVLGRNEPRELIHALAVRDGGRAAADDAGGVERQRGTGQNRARPIRDRAADGANAPLGEHRQRQAETKQCRQYDAPNYESPSHAMRLPDLTRVVTGLLARCRLISFFYHYSFHLFWQSFITY